MIRQRYWMLPVAVVGGWLLVFGVVVLVWRMGR